MTRLALLCLLVAACGSSRSGFVDGDASAGDPGGGDPSSGFENDGGGGPSRDAACAASVEPTTRNPGSVLIVLDRSFSMTRDENDGEPRFGDPSKWDTATDALKVLVDALPDGLNLGLLMYPAPRGCDVPVQPQVAIADIKATRSTIKSYFNQGCAGDTPTEPAIKSANATLASSKGARAIVFLSDGAPNCGSSESSVHAAVVAGAGQGVKTYVVGIPGSPASTFSKLAVAGGTRRSPTCLEECDRSWSDMDKCCHYATKASDFKQSLSKALSEIAAQIRTTCIYTVPRPDAGFDPGKVNVIVSIDGKNEQLVPQSSDPNANGWTYTDGSSTSLVINGPLCQEILGAPASKVEILVGCPTVIK
jgi:hypothetical protein